MTFAGLVEQLNRPDGESDPRAETRGLSLEDKRGDAWFRWIEQRRDATDGEVDIDDVIASGLAALEGGFDQVGARIDAARRRTTAAAEALHGRIDELEAARIADRESHERDVGEAQARISSLEDEVTKRGAEITELRKELASVERSIAQDRSLRRLRDGQRAYPLAQKIDLERARRRTDELIGVTSNGQA
jgi:chromosome segregation ATPase